MDDFTQFQDQCSVKLFTFYPDTQRYTSGQEEITQPIGLYEAMARAIKYNLDYKVGILEEALAGSEDDLGQMDMLPKLILSAGLT